MFQDLGVNKKSKITKGWIRWRAIPGVAEWWL